MFRDIIKRRSHETTSSRDEADFFENASIGLHCVGADGIILRANRVELEMLGYSPEEYIGHHIAEFHADRPVIDDILECLTRGETLRDCSARLRCKDGSIRDVLINSNVLFEDGKFIHTRCFTRDITDRKRAEEELRLNEGLFRATFERSAVGKAQLSATDGRLALMWIARTLCWPERGRLVR